MPQTDKTTGIVTSSLSPYVKSFRERVICVGAIQMFDTVIPAAGANPPVKINLLDRFTEGDPPTLQNQAQARVNANPLAQPATHRQAQNSEMLYQAARKSVTPEVAKRTVLRQSDYSFTNADGHVVYCAVCYLQVLVEVTDTKTKATTCDQWIEIVIVWICKQCCMAKCIGFTHKR